MSAPLNRATEYPFDKLAEEWYNAQAGREGRAPHVGGYRKHADAHKYCPYGRCGSRQGPYAGSHQTGPTRTQKIVAWRKAKAAQNRAYLEEHVYGHKK